MSIKEEQNHIDKEEFEDNISELKKNIKILLNIRKD